PGEAVLLHELRGVIVYTDATPLRPIAGLRTFGFEVPGDLSVVGCDDMEFSPVASPAPSTVRVYRHRLGAVCVAALLAADNAVTPQKLETHFVPRDSTSRASRPAVRS